MNYGLDTCRIAKVQKILQTEEKENVPEPNIREQGAPWPSKTDPRNEIYSLLDTDKVQHMRAKLEMKVQKLRKRAIALWERGDGYKVQL